MTRPYCKAPWVSVSYMPGGKFAPCCQWNGKFFDSVEEMTATVGGKFLAGEVPAECSAACPVGLPGYRRNFKPYATDYHAHSIQFLDFRNNNMCNLKCRSCGPQFSTSWASEADQTIIHKFDPIAIDSIDLSNCRKIYFAGGEPLLNPQHYELLNLLLAQNLSPEIMYSTNTTVLQYKDQSVKDLWPKFKRVQVFSSIDAVGSAAEAIRSGTVWTDVEQNLQWIRSQSNIVLNIATVISAVNIWWMQDLLDYVDNWLLEENFMPVLAYANGPVGLGIIPGSYKKLLIDMLQKSRFSKAPAMQAAVFALNSQSSNSADWHKFLSQQMILDHKRKESWFAMLPATVKDQVYQDLIHGKTQHIQ